MWTEAELVDALDHGTVEWRKHVLVRMMECGIRRREVLAGRGPLRARSEDQESWRPSWMRLAPNRAWWRSRTGGSALPECTAMHPRCLSIRFPQPQRITIDPRVMGGKLSIRGIRITLATITGLLAAGETVGSVLALYPSLERQDIDPAGRDAAVTVAMHMSSRSHASAWEQGQALQRLVRAGLPLRPSRRRASRAAFPRRAWERVA